MECPRCGKPLDPDKKFCPSCGFPVAAVQEEGGPPNAGGPALPGKPRKGLSFLKSPAGTAIAISACLLVAAAVTLGVIFGVKGCSSEEGIRRANKAIAGALEALEKAADDFEELSSSLESLDIHDPEGAKSELEEGQDLLDEASSDVSSSGNDLEDLDTGDLPDWQKECISLLLQSSEEAEAAITEMDEILDRGKSIVEFTTSVDAAAEAFEAAVEAENRAAEQHAAGDYAGAKSSLQASLDSIGEAAQLLQQAREEEPGADLSRLESNVMAADTALHTFESACDAAIAGNYDEHNRLVGQFNQQKEAISMDMTFDGEAYFGAELEEAFTSIEGHAEEAQKKYEEADALYKKNK